ncbi:carbohydrate ABC transporter permease [Microlunatus sp. Y2014]|uniref:carbohydrate ABC transporter permease n=1 Tax=Microlunatus sp. Y2014 TaxID=3418488 RepID=UPI003DA7662C
MKRHDLKRLPAHLILIVVCVAWIYPFIWMLSTSFKSSREMFTNILTLIPSEPSWDNYERAWTSAKFGQFTINTLVVALGVAALVVIISSLAGYALGRGDMPGKKVIIGVLVATMFLPKGYTILPTYILINAMGLNNTLFGVILAEAGPAHIVAILLFTGYFANLPKELEEAAMMDGAGHWRIFWRIMLPLSKPVAATNFLFNFLNAWNAFLIPLVFTLGAPDLRTLGVGMYAFFGDNAIDWTGLAAGGVIAVLPIIVVFLFLQRYFVEGIAGAVRG